MADAVWSGVHCTVEAKSQARFNSGGDLALRVGPVPHGAGPPANVDLLAGWSAHRSQQISNPSALGAASSLLCDAPVEEDVLAQPAASEGEEGIFDDAARLLTATSLHDVPDS